MKKEIILNKYDALEKIYSPKWLEIPREEVPVNFKLAKEVPIHRWYTYKEGFSPSFVRDFISSYQASRHKPKVFDPFGGVGTTVLESSLLGLNAESNDVNPLGNFASKVKSNNYENIDLSIFESVKTSFIADDEKIENIEGLIKNDTIYRYFNPETMKSLLNAKEFIQHIEHIEIKDFYLLAFISLLESFSTHRKDGNGVKKRKNMGCDDYKFTYSEIKAFIIKKIDLYVSDIQSVKTINLPKINFQSSFDPYLLDSKADIVITSPPYANCFDYSKVYLIELWMAEFFQTQSDHKAFRNNSICSHIHHKWEQRHHKFGSYIFREEIKPFLEQQKLWDKKIPSMVEGYFNDMGKALYELSKNLNPNAIIGIVVGNSSYAGLPIPTDLLLSELAEKLGYTFEEIRIYRKLSTSSQQLKVLTEHEKNYLRESLIVLRWQ